MQKLLGIIFVLMMAAIIQAQIKTTDGKRLEEVEKQIVATEERIKLVEAQLTELRKRYNDEWKDNQTVIAELNTLNGVLLKLNLEKKQLLNKQFVKTLPNNQIELLKMIVIQNERIIELLEKLNENR